MEGVNERGVDGEKRHSVCVSFFFSSLSLRFFSSVLLSQCHLLFFPFFLPLSRRLVGGVRGWRSGLAALWC